MLFQLLSNLWNRLIFFILYDTMISKNREQNIMSSFFRNYKEFEFAKHIEKNNSIEEKAKIILKLCTWNIHKGFDIRNRFKLFEVIKYLAYHNFDIVCMQEVNNASYIIDDEKYNISEFIAKKLGYYYYYCKQNTILSKYKIVSTDFKEHYFSDKSYGNYSQIVTIKLENKDVTIFNFHLNCDIFGIEQMKFLQNPEIVESLLKFNKQKIPIIVCGDFNSTNWFKGLKHLKSMLGYSNNFTKYKSTFPTYLPCLQLDKIYTNQQISKSIQLLDSFVDYNNICSDHYPLIGEIELDL